MGFTGFLFISFIPSNFSATGFYCVGFINEASVDAYFPAMFMLFFGLTVARKRSKRGKCCFISFTLSQCT